MSDDEEKGEGAEAQLEDTTVAAEPTEDADEEFSPFDELDEEFQPEPRYVVGSDGMPQVDAPLNESDIPILSSETLVCMEITDEFVIRGAWGDVVYRFDPKEVDVEQGPDGRYRVKFADALPLFKLFKNEEAKRLALQALAELQDGDSSDVESYERLSGIIGHFRQFTKVDSDYVEVQPIRPRCKHYVRQSAQFQYNARNRVQHRLCAARRTTEGTFMSVRDSGMWACDMREPRDLRTEKKILDKFDRDKIQQGKERVYLNIVDGFDQEPKSPKGGGIFGD